MVAYDNIGVSYTYIWNDLLLEFVNTFINNSRCSLVTWLGLRSNMVHICYLRYAYSFVWTNKSIKVTWVGNCFSSYMYASKVSRKLQTLTPNRKAALFSFHAFSSTGKSSVLVPAVLPRAFIHDQCRSHLTTRRWGQGLHERWKCPP